MLKTCPLACQRAGPPRVPVASVTPCGFMLRANTQELPPSSRYWPLGRDHSCANGRRDAAFLPCRLVLKLFPQREAAGAGQGRRGWRRSGPGGGVWQRAPEMETGKGQKRVSQSAPGRQRRVKSSRLKPSRTLGAGEGSPDAGCWPKARLSISLLIIVKF